MLTQQSQFTLLQRSFLVFLFMAIVPFTPLFGQLGPGGVSVETPAYSSGRCEPDTNSTCGMWLDASTLTGIADGDGVYVWPDVSTSYDCDDATVPSGTFAPIYRNDPAYTINGLPTITFEENRHFFIDSSDDLNLNTVTYNKMMFVAFRSSEDVTTKQIIYEEGGTDRGFNIMIQDGLIIIGAYDHLFDNDDGINGNAGNTPAWGYSYISRTIQPNTTYILTSKYLATAPGNVNNNGYYYLQGWLNGISFGGPGQLSGGFNDGDFNDLGQLGTLFDHPNPCGLGAVNDDSVNRDEVIDSQSGVLPFTGKLAEVCYYKDNISETQRIIVENYLASKYLALLDTEDYYQYEYTYGQDLVGIGRKVNPQIHNLSQGRNPFVISSASNMSSAANQFFMTGHNGEDNVWTDVGVPNNSSNIERLRRVWRVDRNNFTYSINLKLDKEKLPTVPVGYSTSNAKLVLLVDETSPNIPDFTLETTVVKELGSYNTAPFDFEVDYNLPQGAFYTFAWLKPEVNFVETQQIAIESNPSPDYAIKFIEAKLNYQPTNNGDAINDGYTVEYSLIPGTAVLGPGPAGGDDFYYNSSTSGLTSDQITFNEGVQIVPIAIRIINDTDPEDPSTEDFTVNITNTTAFGNAPDLEIGANSVLAYTIYDDDPPPKISFVSYATPIDYTEGEASGSAFVDIIRNGTAGAVTCKVKVIAAGTTARNSDLGSDPADYDNTFTTLTVSFPAGGPVTQTVEIPINDDSVDEPVEHLQLRIYSLTGGVAALSTDAINQVIDIHDNDIPVASFASSGQSGYESIGAPSLLVTLDPISSRDVVVDFSMTPGSATYNQDYTGFPTGSIVFPPFASEAYVGPFNVSPDATTEPPETVLFSLEGTTPDGDPTIIQPSNLTYTILDYEPFEWKGVAGVGKSTDNIIWIDASQEALGDLDNISNRSPYGLSITKNGNPATNTANAINGMNAFHFNGSSSPGSADAYKIENSTKINIAGTVDRLSYYFVVSPDAIPNSSSHPANATSTHARILYEQGGNSRGTSIYLYNNKLYFHAWNNPDDDGTEGDQAPWGHTNSGSSGTSGWINSLYAVSSQNLVSGTNYIISCHYDNSNETEPLMVYVNGVKGTMSDLTAGSNSYGVGRLWGHSGDIGLGADVNITLLHFTRDDLSNRECPFSGKMAEFILFHEPEMTESRRTIIENYLSAKYSIPLDNNNTVQLWDLSDPEEDLFKHGIAGVGQESGGASAHTDSKGPNTVLRINNPSFDANNMGYIIWGNNGEELTNTWPYSSDASNVLPDGIEERSGQVWKIFENGTVNSASIHFDFSASNNSTALSGDDQLLKLLVHYNSDPQDFSTATVYNASSILTGNIVKFDNIPISDGMYLTLGNTSDYFNTPLPIELLSFDAKYNGDVVLLNWSTASELNNEKFIIERAGEDLRFEPILTTDGAGNSNTILYYNDVDNYPLNGLSYYRLKQVDYDGQFEYSDPVSIYIEYESKDVAFKLYPNPNRTQTLNIYKEGDIESQDDIVIDIVDITGNVLHQSFMQKDAQSKTIQLPYEMRPGLYLVRFSNKQLNKTYKLVISN